MRDDLTNQRFGRWLAVSRSEIRKYGTHISYNCRCDCGTERLVSGSLLRNGNSMSCGCAFVEAAAKSQLRHGLTGHKLHGTWRSMKERCYNPNHEAFHRYGGRGIKVCERWHSLVNFVKDNEPLAIAGLTLDRRDNDGPYSPTNCHWVSRQRQALNRSNTQMLTYRGQTKPLADWANERRIKANTLKARLATGWTTERALTTPPREYDA